MSLPRGAGLGRRVRGLGGHLIRRAGLLPDGMPNGLGQDDILLGRRLPHAVMVFFPDPPATIHRIERWYGSLRELDRRHRVVVVTMDSRTGGAVRRRSGLDTIVVARYSTVDDLLSRSDVKVALYVSDHVENFSNLRFSSMVHVDLATAAGISTQEALHAVQAYDFALVTGPADMELLAAALDGYDARTRCIAIGRPWAEGPDSARQGDRRVGVGPAVLYAPTRPATAGRESICSASSLGPGLVRAFLDDGWSVIYRPHPAALRGSHSNPAGVGAADGEIRALVRAATRRGGRDRIDPAPDLGPAFDDADVVVCDPTPGVAVDWLVRDRPMFVTVPTASGRPAPARADGEADADTDGEADADVDREAETRPPATIDDLTRVGLAEVSDIATRAREHLGNDPGRSVRELVARHYLPDPAGGPSVARFLTAVDRFIEVRDAEMARLRAVRANRSVS